MSALWLNIDWCVIMSSNECRNTQEGALVSESSCSPPYLNTYIIHQRRRRNCGHFVSRGGTFQFYIQTQDMKLHISVLSLDPGSSSSKTVTFFFITSGLLGWTQSSDTQTCMQLLTVSRSHETLTPLDGWQELAKQQLLTLANVS